jgi:hypothetical protein
MAATACPIPTRSARPHLRLVGAGGRRPNRLTFWRRRLALVLVAVLVVTGAGLVLRAAGGLITHGPPAAPAKPLPSSSAHVVQPGDTIWSVARRLQPDGDVRPLVDRLVAAHAGSSLKVGEVIALQ